MKEREDKLEAASFIWWGQFSSDDLDTLPQPRTPEDEMISKELLDGKDMPGELRYAIKTIANLPEEYFLKNGRLNRQMAIDTLQARMGRSKSQIKDLLNRLRKRIES